VLVLGVGGVLGRAWLTGVLAGIEDASGFDLRNCEHFVGTSAGSIVAAHLAAGESPRRPSKPLPQTAPAEPETPPGLEAAAIEAARLAGAAAIMAGAPFARAALRLSAPAGALIRAALLQAVPRPSGSLEHLHSEIEQLDVRFDGRLRIVAVDRGRGRRVVFGRPGAPRAPVADAVRASCAVPWLFPAVQIAGREYVDGGVWSATNLDAAPAGRDTHVLCLVPTAGLAAAHTLGGIAGNVARSAASLEALVLRHRGAAVRIAAPSPEAAAAMGADLMDREPFGRVLEAGYRQGLGLGKSDRD
jgi:NTE family protein